LCDADFAAQSIFGTFSTVTVDEREGCFFTVCINSSSKITDKWITRYVDDTWYVIHRVERFKPLIAKDKVKFEQCGSVS